MQIPDLEGQSRAGREESRNRRTREVSLTQDQNGAINGLQFVIRNPKMERVRERERIYLNAT